jgi:hypothetical protein
VPLSSYPTLKPGVDLANVLIQFVNSRGVKRSISDI